jgi:hypothetical protein
MDQSESRKWTFQLNIMGLTLLLFASGYIGRHAALLMPVSGFPQLSMHYLGESVLTVVAVLTALWRAYGTSERHYHRVAWMEKSAVCFYLGLGAVVLNVLLMILAVVMGVKA